MLLGIYASNSKVAYDAIFCLYECFSGDILFWILDDNIRFELSLISLKEKSHRGLKLFATLNCMPYEISKNEFKRISECLYSLFDNFKHDSVLLKAIEVYDLNSLEKANGSFVSSQKYDPNLLEVIEVYTKFYDQNTSEDCDVLFLLKRYGLDFLKTVGAYYEVCGQNSLEDCEVLFVLKKCNPNFLKADGVYDQSSPTDCDELFLLREYAIKKMLFECDDKIFLKYLKGNLIYRVFLEYFEKPSASEESMKYYF